MKRSLLLPALVVPALLAGCGSSGSGDKASTPSLAKPTSTITIANFEYAPEPAVVKAGTKVSVTNKDDAPHTLTDKGSPRAFDSGTVKHGQTRTVTFSKPGTYAYTCLFHPTMAGKVTVTK